MIDLHSHILPGVDDGSKNVSESIAMLEMLSEQGIKTVAATPHFYADHESVDDFLKRRDEAFERLRAELKNDEVCILRGAEVRYYPGIGRMQDICKLCIENSKLLLLEMPMSKWTEYTVKELVEMSSHAKITLVIAHMERYMDFQSERTLERLYESGIFMQFNASFFLGFSTKRKAISMLESGEIHLLGSDCHNISSRPPRIGKAYEMIRKKLGDAFASRVNEYGYMLLNK